MRRTLFALALSTAVLAAPVTVDACHGNDGPRKPRPPAGKVCTRPPVQTFAAEPLPPCRPTRGHRLP